LFTPPKQSTVGKVRFKVTLGIMPDYSFQESGVRADGVTENKPAAGITIVKAGANYTFSTKVALDGRHFETKHYWLPIPRAEILASNNQLAQNSGY
jgi:hypothetical protein